MKSISTLHFALMITTIVIGITFFYPSSEQQHIVSILVVSAVWVMAFYKTQNEIKQHEIVVKRVEELKGFSIELQSLVGKELALVQEDVIRIRGIVSDSIGILQESTHNINQNMDDSKKYLEECLSKLNTSGSNNVAGVDSDAKNSKGCDCNTAKGMMTDTNILNSDVIHLGPMRSFDDKSKMDIGNMMMALQFEDIVSQISERVAQHVGDIRSTVDILSNLCESELSNTFESDMSDMKLEYSAIKEKLLKVAAKNLAAQKNMDEGDVDLF